MPPLPGQWKLHAGCGFFAGLVVGTLSAIEWSPALTRLGFVVRVLAIAILCGGLAYWQGDRFWKFMGFARWHRFFR